MIDGEKESGVTIMQMDAGLDTGDMIARVTVPIAPEETGGSLFDKLSQAGAQLLVETLPSLENHTAVFEKQPQESPTAYAGMIRKEMGNLDWKLPALRLERLIRGLNPWPSAYTFLGKKSLKLWRAQVLENVSGQDAPAGTVLQADAGGFLVQTGNGILKILELQLEGKKRMDAEAFLRGCQIPAGTVLTQNRQE